MNYTYLLKDFVDFLSLVNINSLKNKFQLDFIKNKAESEELNNIRDIDYDKGDIIYYENSTNEFIIYTFEEFLNTQYNFKVLNYNIDNVAIELTSTVKKQEFINYVKRRILYVLEKEDDIFSKYPFLKHAITDLIEHLNKEYKCKIDLPFTLPQNQISEPLRPFRLKEKYSDNKKLIELYNILTNNDIINKSTITPKEFLNLISGNITDSKIRFECKTYQAVLILKTLEHIYHNFGGTIIEKSNRFYTKETNNKPAKLLSAKIYHTEISRMTPLKSDSIKDIVKQIRKIYPALKSTKTGR